MEKYENLGLVGEGSYGLVMKCRHRETGQVVAVKKFLENEDDATVKKIALREVRMLKKLRHENLVNLIEVFRRRRRLYLVFEFVDHTILDELEQHSEGLDEDRVRQHTWQVLRALDFCHSHNIIHRDIKPENVLVSRLGVVKLCDFGFARVVADPFESCTDYVATRWYRAPELLVGDTKYGKEVDVWAVGCLFAEMLTGDPLFPGESDIDQIYFITSYLGPLVDRHQESMANNPMFSGIKMKSSRDVPAGQKLANSPILACEFIKLCLSLDPTDRPSCTQLLNHKYFTCDRFPEKFLYELKLKIQQEFRNNPLLKKQLPSSNSFRRTGADEHWKNRKNKVAKESPGDDASKFRFRAPADDVPLSKSSAISVTSKLRLTPPKLIPTKIAPLVPRSNKPSSPKSDFRPSPDIKDYTPSAIPPIGQFIDFPVNSSALDVASLGAINMNQNQNQTAGRPLLLTSLSSAENPKPSWLTEKSKKASQFQKKGPPTPHTASTSGNSSVLNSLLQGERSQLHDKGTLVKRKTRPELGTLRLQPMRDEFSLPDVPGATGSPVRGLRPQKKTSVSQAMPLLSSIDQSTFMTQDENQSPSSTLFEPGLPFV